MTKKFTLLTVALTLCLSGLFAQLPKYLPAGAAGWYPFNNNTNDSSGNNRHLLSTGINFGVDRFGNANSACLFNGTSEYLNRQSFAGLTNSFFTILPERI